MRAILVLYLLTLRGRIREQLRRLAKPLPLVAAVVLAGGFGVVLIPAFLFAGEAVLWDPELVGAFAPMLMLAMVISTLSNPYHGQGQLIFSSAETAFLFPGPFSRRNLLFLKWVEGLLRAAPPAAFIAIWLSGMPGGYAAAFAVLWLIFLYIAAVTTGARFVWALLQGRTSRAIATVLLFLAVVWGIWEAREILDFARWDEALADGKIVGVVALVQSTWLAKILLAPFLPFGEWLASETAVEFLRRGGICLSLYGGLTGVLFWLNVDFREGALRASLHREKMLEKARSGRLPASESSRDRWHLTLPVLPAWSGAGVILWRHWLTALRELGRTGIRFLLLLGALAFVAQVGDFGFHDGMGDVFWVVLLAWTTIVLSGGFISCDFRSDLAHMDLLKTLPIPPLVVVASEVLAPTLFLWMLQILLLALVWVAGLLDLSLALLAAAGCLPLNLVLFLAENLAALLFPLEMETRATPGQIGMRGLLIFLVKGVILSLVGLLSGGFGLMAGYLTGSVPLGISVGGAVFLAACTGGLALLGKVFERYEAG